MCTVTKWLKVLWCRGFTQRKPVRLGAEYGAMLNPCVIKVICLLYVVSEFNWKFLASVLGFLYISYIVAYQIH